jgi:WD40 repeat protein
MSFAPQNPAKRDRQDKSRLLRGEALQEALNWAEGRSLSPLDREFLLVSQQEAIAVEREEKRILEGAIAEEKKIKSFLQKAQRKAKRLIRLGSVVLLITVLIAGLIFYKSQQQLTIAKIEQKGIYALQQFEFQPIKGHISAIDSGKKLQNLGSRLSKLWDYPAASPLLALQKIIDDFHIKNEIDTHQKGVNTVFFVERTCKSVDRNCILITAGEDGTVRRWKALSETEIARLQAHKLSVKSVRFSKNEKELVTASEDGSAARWLANAFNESNPKPLVRFNAHKEGVQNIRFSPDDSFILTSGEKDGLLKAWNLDGKMKWERQAHEGGIKSLNFHPQNDRLATGGKDGTAKLWSLNGDFLQVFEHDTLPNRAGVNSVNFNKMGDKLATAGDDGLVKIWDINDKLISTITAHVGKVETVRFNPKDERQIVTSASDDPTSTNSSVVRIWNWETKELLAEFKGHQGSVESIRYSPDGKTLATAGKEDGIVRVWKIDRISEPSGDRHEGKINSVRLNSNASRYVTAGDDGTVRLWSIGGELLAKFDKYQGKTKFMSNRFHPKDDSLIAVGDRLGQIRLLKFNGRNLTELKKFTQKHEDAIESLNFSPDGKLIGTASRDKTVKIWNLQGEVEQTIPYNTRVWSLRFSPDSRYFVVGGENSGAYLYDLSKGKQRTLKNPDSENRSIVYAVGFSRDGKFVFTVDDDSTIYKWDFSGKPVDKPLESYQGSVRNIGIVDEVLATAGSGGTVHLWNFRGQQIADFKGHRGTVRSLGLSQDGKRLVSAGDDGVPRVWEIRSLDELLKQGCDRLEEYLKNHPQEPKCLR